MADPGLVDEMLSKTGKMLDTIRKKHISSILHGEMFLLAFMVKQKRAMLPGELSAAAGTSTARVAMALRSLESKGLIEREVDKADRRRVLVTVTDNGISLIHKKHEEIKIQIEMLLDKLGESDAREYIRILGRMIEIAEARSDEG